LFVFCYGMRRPYRWVRGAAAGRELPSVTQPK
jgi:hypothetical protein